MALSNLPDRNPFFTGRERGLTQLHEVLAARGRTALSEAAPVMPRTTHNLPFPPNPAFTGRADELKKLHEELQKRLEVSVTQTVAIHGLGGIGKTQLAVEYAWKHLDDYDAVFWVKADSPEVLDGGLAALASLLRLPEAGERKEAVQIEAVLGWLHRHERWLLIADNADSDEAARALSDRLPPSLPGQVFITSRISDWPVNIQDLALDLLSPDAATRYLLERVARRRHNAGDEAAAGSLADELGDLPLALEQAASFIFEVKWTFEKYQKTFREARLLSEHSKGVTRYPTSVAKTWSITLDQLNPLARSLLRLAAWFAADAIPRGIFSADHNILAEALGEKGTVSDLAIEKALGELDRFSLVRLTSETVSVHRLLQAVEQDSLDAEKRKEFLLWATRLFNEFAPDPDDVSTWDVWLPLSSHAERLIEHTKIHGIEALPIALVANKFGVFLNARGAYAQVEPLLERALAIREEALGPAHPDVAASLHNLAALYYNQGQYTKAECLYDRALAILEKALGPDHPDVAAKLNNLAGLYEVQGRYAKVEAFYRRALKIREKINPEHRDVATSLNGLAAHFYTQNQYTQAEPLFQRALAIREEALGPKDPGTAESRYNLALLYLAQGQYAKAEPLFRRALAIRKKAFGPEHPATAASLNGLAALYYTQGQFAKAEPFYVRALAIRKKGLGLAHPDVAESLTNLALLYFVQSQYAKAEPLYQQAIAIVEKALGPEHPDLAQSLEYYALLLRKTGRSEEAATLETRAMAIRSQSA